MVHPLSDDPVWETFSSFCYGMRVPKKIATQKAQTLSERLTAEPKQDPPPNEQPLVILSLTFLGKSATRDDTVPHLRHSDPLRDFDSQPFRAGLTFGGRLLRQAQGRPSGPRIRGDFRCHFSLKLPQAIQLLGMTKGGVASMCIR